MVVMAGLATMGSGEAELSNGLITGHAYSVLGLHRTRSGEDLIKVPNGTLPWLR